MAGKIHDVKVSLEKALNDNSRPWSAAFAKIEQATGVNRLNIFIVGAVVVGLWLAFGYAAQLVCNIVGFIYPAYASIHALETSRKDDDMKWLTYWVVFSIFSVFEFFSDVITRWLPLYWLLKCIFMVWLMIPGDFNGSNIVYNKVIRPYFVKHHGSIDQTLNKMKDEASKLLNMTEKDK